jgi:hypothetical protein
MSISSGTLSRPRKRTSANSSRRNSQKGSSSVAGVDAEWRRSRTARRELVVRVEDEHAQIGRVASIAFTHEQRHGRRLADAGGADDREVARQRIVDGDAGVDRVVLRQLADVDRLAGRRDRRRACRSRERMRCAMAPICG